MSNPSDPEEPTGLLPEDQVHMEDCTCDHPPERHGWMECLEPSCPCRGGWTE